MMKGVRGPYAHPPAQVGALKPTGQNFRVCAGQAHRRATRTTVHTAAAFASALPFLGQREEKFWGGSCVNQTE